MSSSQTSEIVEAARAHFGEIVEQQLARVNRLKQDTGVTDYSKLRPLKIGIIGGDGIGPAIAHESRTVLERLLHNDVEDGAVRFHDIEGLTIENRAAEMQSIPDDVMAQIKDCHVTLKGPTHTPEQGDGWPNLESANVVMRKELDLFANIRPVRIPQEGIDWTIFRENTEDMYAVGSQGIHVTPDLAIDFRVITTPGSERIIDAAFAHARRSGGKKVTVITKANIVKATDGKFLDVAREIAAGYPEIEWDSWYIDIMTAKLLDTARRNEFQVMVAPNMYGDIITDEAAQIQGGVGTAGSANAGQRYAMFEAIHGSAPRMVAEGRAQFADPSSMLRAGAMMLEHIGFEALGSRLHKALDLCGQYERKIVITGRDTGATSSEFGEYVLSTVDDPQVEDRWAEHTAQASA